MNYVLCNRDPNSHVGGDAFQVNAYTKQLERKGHQAKYVWALDFDASKYDEAWLFHINMGWTVRQWRSVQNAGIPYRVFAIFYPGFYSDTNHEIMKEILMGAKKVYCLSIAESEELKKEFPEIQTHIITNGYDDEVFFDIESERSYVMTAGRIDASKGIHRVIQACKELDFSVLIAGITCTLSYEEECRKIWDSPKVRFEKNCSQDKMKDLYRLSKVYVCASDSERNSLCVIEAAASGCSIVSSDRNRGNEWFEDLTICKYNDIEDIKNAIRKEWLFGRNRKAEVVAWREVVSKILES